MYHDLRSFLKQLEADGDLLRISEPLAPEPDAAALADAAFQTRGPAILMENIRGAASPVVVGVHATHGRIGRALGMERNRSASEILAEIDRRWDRYPVASEVLPGGPCQEEVLEEDGVDLTRFPAYRINERDGGPYFSKGLVITRSPKSGVYNLSIARLQLKGKDRLGIFSGLSHGPTMHYREAEELGMDRLPVAVAMGCDPLLGLAAASPLPESWDEYQFAGALRGEPTRLTRARSNDLLVPALAEIILEGYMTMDPGDRELEGPFGEFTGSYSGVYRTPVIHITAITCRANPIMEQVTIGRPPRETEIMPHIPFSVSILRQARQLVPDLVSFNAASTQSLTSVASIRQRRGGRAKQVMAAIWSLDAGFMVKNLFVVDDEIDVFDWDQVMWAFSTRFRGAADLVVIPHSYSTVLDPTGNPRGMITRHGFDCTMPVAPDELLESRGMVDPRPEVGDWSAWLQGSRQQMPVTRPSHPAPDRCPRCSGSDIDTIAIAGADRSLRKCARCNLMWREGEHIRLHPRDTLDAESINRITWMPPRRNQ